MSVAKFAATHCAVLALSGCSVLPPLISLELVKAGSMAALANQRPRPSGTVHHGDATVNKVCVEYNRDMPLDEMIPVLQAELKNQGVISRVYDVGSGQRDCAHWLQYVGSIEWGVPPFSSQPRPYISAVTLSLRRADGRLLSTSSIKTDSGPRRWASTQAKLAPVVKALITGFET